MASTTKALALFLAMNLLVLGLAASASAATDHLATSMATTTSSTVGKCPQGALKFGVCANVLGLAKVKVGGPETRRCCSLLNGLVDLDVAVCLCTAIKANVLGIRLNVPLDLSVLLGACRRNAPAGFKCSPN